MSSVSAAYATNGIQTLQAPGSSGIAVIGEAVRRVPPEAAEFLVEITASGATGSQAMQNHQSRMTQITQMVSSLGTHRGDLQTVSLNVSNVFAPVLQGIPAYGIPQIGQAAFGTFTAQPAVQPEIQFGTYQAKSVVRVIVNDAAYAPEIADMLVKNGASLASGLWYRASDEAGARRSVLEAAGKDARTKAETLAISAGKQLGEPVAISEDIVASNGIYSALRAQMPLAFGPNTPSAIGELEYYARVTANFQFQ